MFRSRLKELRRKRGLTQEELAHKLKATKGTISNYENGHSTPSNEMLRDLANVLNTSTDYLLGRTDNPNTLPIEKTADEQLRDFLSDPQMLVAFHDYEEWSENDKLELLNYLKAKKMSRDINKSSN